MTYNLFQDGEFVIQVTFPTLELAYNHLLELYDLRVTKLVGTPSEKGIIFLAQKRGTGTTPVKYHLEKVTLSTYFTRKQRVDLKGV